MTNRPIPRVSRPRLTQSVQDLTAKAAEARAVIELIGELLEQHGCESLREIPEDARRAVWERAKKLMSRQYSDEIEAYFAGGPRPDAKLLRVLPDSFFGRIQ